MVTVMFESYPDIVTVQDLCKMLNIGKNTAYTLLNNGSIASIRIGRKFLIPKSYITDYFHVQNSLHRNEKEV